MTIRCAVVDDHPVYRDGLARMLDALPDVEIVCSGGTAAEAVRIAREHAPHVLLLDLRLPDLSGMETVPAIRAESPGTHVIILTGLAEEDTFVEAFKFGARGVLLKDMDIDRIAEEVRVVASGGVRLDASLGARLVGELHEMSMRNTPRLTPREIQILRLLTQGKSNCEVASALGIQSNTVKSHLSRLFKKLGVTDRLQAALYAVRLGLDDDTEPGGR